LARAVGTSYATGRATILYNGPLGDDYLIGGLGNDILSGGIGRDRFVLTVGSDPHLITDLTKGEDLLVLASGLTFAQLKYYPKC